MNSKVTKNIKEIGILFIGCLFMSISLNLFLNPYKIAPGGITGLSIVISSVTNIPLSTLNLMFNIPLFLIAYKLLKKRDVIKTILGIAMLTTCLQITKPLAQVVLVTKDPLLACIMGAMLCGIGVGLIFRINGTTGGTDLIGVLLNKICPQLSPTSLMGIADFIVVVLSGIVSKNIEIGLYSSFALMIIIKVIDMLVDGLNYSKSFMIISNKSNEISKVIMEELVRGVTILRGEGAYTGNEKKVLLVVVSKRQVTELKRIIREIDKNAFIIVTDATEILGEGFVSIEG